jgi:hypothetical protein
MLRLGQSTTQNTKIYRPSHKEVAPLTKPNISLHGLDQSLQGVQNNGRQSGFVQAERKKLRPGPNAGKKSGLAKIGGDDMNRLRMMLVGAALITGGSALASAQVVQQDVSFRDRDHDKDRDRDRGHDRDRDRGYDNYRVYRGGDRDDRRYVDRDGRYDRRYDGYSRRWDGRRWAYWNGRNWVY